MNHSRSDNNTNKNIDLVLKISLICISSSTIVNAVSSTMLSSIVLGFHTNSTRNMAIPGMGLPSMESQQPAIEAQEHINAASQALQSGNNSEVLLHLQIANRMLSHFIGSGLVNTTTVNITAFQTPTSPIETNAGLINNQTVSGSNSLEESPTQMSRQQEVCSEMSENGVEGQISQNCPY